LHIGSEKTGTASLHKFLDVNREQLNRHSLTYFCHPSSYYSQHSKAHSPIVASFLPEPPDFISPGEHVDNQRMLAELKSDLSAEKRNVIISSEHFSSRLRSQVDIEKLRDAMRSFHVYVIFYMRSQYELYFSSYSTAVINGRREPPDFAELSPDNPYLNYVRLLEPWTCVFGKENIVVRDYDHLVGGDICADFLQLIGIRDHSGFKKTSRSNRSLGKNSAEIIRRLNAFFPRHKESSYLLYSLSIELRWLVNSFISLLCGDERVGNPPMKSRIESIFDRSNKELLGTYAAHIEQQVRTSSASGR